MFVIKLFPFIFLLQVTRCDWVSEWMSPIEDQFQTDAVQRNNPAALKMFDDDERMIPVAHDTPELETSIAKKTVLRTSNNDIPMSALKINLENTIQNARLLAQTLKIQINTLTIRENMLKETIVNGRSGITVATVSTMGHPPRAYVVRDGYWTLCEGVLKEPVLPSGDLFNEKLSVPKCVGKEVSIKQDPCVFNSIIKYETIPEQREIKYTEDDFLCLKTVFNTTLEQYYSVPRRLINETCKNGIIRSLTENTEECGLRVLSEYTYYPYRGSAIATVPLEYCTEKNGACKLIVAWHVSNSTIENFEFLKNEKNFKKFFIKPMSYVEHVI